MNTPDFKTSQERDDYFRDHADYYTLIKKGGVGVYDRTEYLTLDSARKAGQTKNTVGGTGLMIYAVIGEQSAFVEGIKPLERK